MPIKRVKVITNIICNSLYILFGNKDGIYLAGLLHTTTNSSSDR